MSNAELNAALRDAKAEVEWLRAESELQEAADILDRINAEHSGTVYARRGQSILSALSEQGIEGNRLRLPPASTTAPLSQAPATRPQTP